MTTTLTKSRELRALRNISRPKPPKASTGECPLQRSAAKSPITHSLHNNIEQIKSQQIKEKHEKDSNSPITQQIPTTSCLPEKGKRITRSSVIPIFQKQSQPELNVDQLTPEDNKPSIVEEEETCKKVTSKMTGQDSQEILPMDSVPTVKKNSFKNLEVISPFNEQRKSYRKIHKREIVSIPYRKCHDQFQGRIVSIINKIQNDKNCLRDLEGLIDKVQKIAPKDMLNKYIVSGIKTITKTARYKQIYDVKLINRLEDQFDKMKVKIKEQLDRIDFYQEGKISNTTEELVESCSYKNAVVKKIYGMLKNKFPHKHRFEVKKKALNMCQTFFGNEVNISKTVRFIKSVEDIQE